MAKKKHHAPYFGETKKVTMIHAPVPSPVKPKKKAPKRPQSNLQLLRETQQFRNSLQQSDLFWETWEEKFDLSALPAGPLGCSRDKDKHFYTFLNIKWSFLLFLLSFLT